MTLGKKLSNYRKLSEMTQQQLGDYLNLGAQAISKWENDLAEPDLATLRALSSLYKVSVDDLLNTDVPENMQGIAHNNAGDSQDTSDEASSAEETPKKEEPRTIGFCKVCGIAVTEEELGQRSPYVMCKACKAEEERKIMQAESDERRRKEALAREEEAKKSKTRDHIRHERKKSLIVAGIVTGIYIIALIYTLVNYYSTETLIGGLVMIYPVFAFISMLFYDSPVLDVISYMCSASIKWPGLIFSWDIDGFIWVICMKLTFAVIGFFFGLATTVLGIVLGIVISPFVFPYIMVKLSHSIATSQESDHVF